MTVPLIYFYLVNFATPGHPANASGASIYLDLGEQVVEVTGFGPSDWEWTNLTTAGLTATLPVSNTGLLTLTLSMREDGLRIDRLLLTTDTTYIPTGFGPPETNRLLDPATISTTLTRTIVYTYDHFYRLTEAAYSTGEFFHYTYDPNGNRTTQTTLAGTNVYTYDVANRLVEADGLTYTWETNGHLLADGTRTFGYDTADRLTSVTAGGLTAQFGYNGDGDRVSQTVNGLTTEYVNDPVGLAQVLAATTNGQSTFYIPGLAEYDTAWRYYLPEPAGQRPPPG